MQIMRFAFDFICMYVYVLKTAFMLSLLYFFTFATFHCLCLVLFLSLSLSSNGNWSCMLPLFYDDLIIFFTTHNYTHRYTCWIYCPYAGQKYANKCCNRIHFLNERTENVGFVAWIFKTAKLIETLEFHVTKNKTPFSQMYSYLMKMLLNVYR